MHLTQDPIINIARETVEQRVRENRNIFAAYLCGSVLQGEAMLGGTTDIDLVFVHFDRPQVEREIVPLTSDVHFDIAHHEEKDYKQPRQLRLHPWLGPTMNACTILYDPRHFMDFTQASVRGQFDVAERVIARARLLAGRARQILLSCYQEISDPPVPAQFADYLRAIWQTVNAIASLSGPPLTERRLLLKYPGCAEAVGRPGLYPGLLGLLGAPLLKQDTILGVLEEWKEAFLAIPAADCPAHLQPDRMNYYWMAFKAIGNSDQAVAVLWPLLRTWTTAICLFHKNSAETAAWREFLAELGLMNEGFNERISALAAYLNLVDETIDEWGLANGVWER